MDGSKLTYSQFLDWFPEFTDVPMAAGTFRLELSAELLSLNAWGRMYKRACALLTAHYLWLRYDMSGATSEAGMRSPSATIGIATTKSATTSGISEGIATSGLLTSDDPILADLARTEYGLEFLSLLYTYMPACGVVFSPDSSAKYWSVQ